MEKVGKTKAIDIAGFIVVINRSILFIHFVIVSCLVVLAPYTMRLSPDAILLGDSNFITNFRDSGEYGLRCGLVYFGLVAAISSSCLLLLGLCFLRKCRRQWLPVHISLTLCAWNIGWRCFPYWVNGVYLQTVWYSSSFPMDPQELIPMLWIGEYWRLGALFVYLMSILGIGGLLVYEIRWFLLRKSFDQQSTWNLKIFCTTMILLFISILTFTFFYSGLPVVAL
jgi:hypothetical protein